MSEQPATKRRTVNRDVVRARFQRLNLYSRKSVIGPAEMIGLAGSVFILALVIVAHLYFLGPSRSRVEALQTERSRLKTQIGSSADSVRHEQSTEATVQNITESLDAFESKQLPGADRGRMGLYDSLNQLIRENGLRNTSGPTYTPLDPTGSKVGTSGSRTANTKLQSIYPGIAISLTVEGQYQNLRRFIRDIETNKQFVIINSVELERATETNSSPSAEGGATGGARGALVSLRLEMATYFQRSSSEAPGLNSLGH